METADIKLAKAVFEDWRAMYYNVWSRPETARYMFWNVTTSEEGAQIRIQKTIEFQKTHDTYLIYEKENGQAIGFAGVENTAPGVFQETGIALGPEFVGKGYGTQVLQLLLDHCKALDGKIFYYFTREENLASKALASSFGFTYLRSEAKIDARNEQPYQLEVYVKNL